MARAESKSGKNGCRGIPGPGRPKGLKNKITVQLKDMVLGALNDAGGQAYLLRMANHQPKAFLSLLGRVLPQEVKGDQTITVAGLDWTALLKPTKPDDAA